MKRRMSLTNGEERGFSLNMKTPRQIMEGVLTRGSEAYLSRKAGNLILEKGSQLMI